MTPLVESHSQLSVEWVCWPIVPALEAEAEESEAQVQDQMGTHETHKQTEKQASK